MTAAPTDDATEPDLTALVQNARRGLRRDVAAFEAALDDAQLLVPLASGVHDAPEGEAVPLDRKIEIQPHFLVDEEGMQYAALFTRAELMGPVARALEWKTDGGELGVGSFPARVACELALSVIDETTVHGLVIDPGEESELLLRRSELASIVAGHPLPLVGYLRDLPPLEDEQVLLAEPLPLPAELTESLQRCLASQPQVTGHRLERTFNPERDLEPHLTLRLTIPGEADRRAIANAVIEAIGELIPPPGYIDIVVDDG